MTDEQICKIRPAARHIFTVGRDLIQSPYAAVVELVKNSYDADASFVEISFKLEPAKDLLTISISDDGHGMSRENIVNDWMVPSSDNKLKRRISPGGRALQGRKGIGRYSASILGEDLLLTTVDSKSIKTTVFIAWEAFEKAIFLSDVDILIQSEETSEKPSTRLDVTKTLTNKVSEQWKSNNFEELKRELKKLKTPSSVYDAGDSFDIKLSVSGFGEKIDFEGIIEPFPIVDLFDYKISGLVDEFGIGELVYESQKLKNSTKEVISIDFSNEVVESCGVLNFDIRVFDRDPDAISKLISRGLKDESGNYLGKREAKNLLDINNGLGVYRGEFRIRPLGDPNFDWLKLNSKRIQNPGVRVSDNQVIGFVHIKPEEESNLEEKSARDGLVENASYETLQKITLKVIALLEERRYLARRSLEPRQQIEIELRKLFSGPELKEKIVSKLDSSGVSKDIKNSITMLIDSDAKVKNAAAERISKVVATYQDQATLGKIINVVLHEGRRPLSFFKTQTPNLHYWYSEYQKDSTEEAMNEILSLVNGFGLNADAFAKLFSKLDPLASGQRSKQKTINLYSLLKSVITIFDNKITELNVNVSIEGPEDFVFFGWQQDFYAIFANLFDNSLYWLENSKSTVKEISIKFQIKNNHLEFIDYRDTGPGIEKNHIESEIIFEPDFSTKQGEKSGLGLAIAGEAATRNELEFKAFESETGAYFRLLPKQPRVIK